MAIAYWIMIAVVVITCITVIIVLTGNAKQCLADPLEYYMKKTFSECFCSEDMARFITP